MDVSGRVALLSLISNQQVADSTPATGTNNINILKEFSSPGWHGKFKKIHERRDSNGLSSPLTSAHLKDGQLLKSPIGDL